MKPDHVCVNHSNQEAVSFCHCCHDWLCSACVAEGQTHYYCRKPECFEALEREGAIAEGKCPFCGKATIPDVPRCGACGKELRELTAEEKSEDLIIIARFNNAIEAHLAQTKLESEDIDSYIADEHMVSLNPGYDIAFGGVKLQVKKSDVVRANDILGENQENPA